MKCRLLSAALLATLALGMSAFAQAPVRPTRLAAKTARHLHRPSASANKSPARQSAAPSPNSWIDLNAQMLGSRGESTWVNLGQVTSIRFFATKKTPFAAVGTGGSSFITTSDPGEIRKLRSYVLTHQMK